MKVSGLVDILNGIHDRLAVVVIDPVNGTETPVHKHRYNRDGGWSQFMLILCFDGEPADVHMDTDWLKHILDYELSDPDYKPSFFSNEPFLGEYDVKVSYQNGSYTNATSCVCGDGRLKIFIEESL